MSPVITKDDSDWLRLYQAWVEQKQAGWVVIGGTQYRVLRPSDEEVSFELVSGFDTMYGSITQGLP